jgi:hypothetical protein
MVYALQSVEVRNNVTLEQARGIAQKFIKDDKKKFHKEKKNFYGFRNIPKQKFVKDSFRSKKINDNIILLYGDLKEGNEKLIGKGFIDVLKDPIGTIKEAFRGAPSKYSYKSKETLDKYGNMNIKELTIARTPLNKILTTAINTISLGEFKKLQEKYGLDKLYHLSLIATLSDNQKIIIEKNEVITIEPLSSSSSIKSNTEYLKIPVTKKLTLNTMMENTKKAMGDNLYFSYESFKNNCQHMILQILSQNHMLTQNAKDFLFQNVDRIGQDLEKSDKFNYVPKIMHKITNLGSIASRLMGKGNTNEVKDAFDKYLKKSGIDSDDLKLLTPAFLDFINSEGLKFL